MPEMTGFPMNPYDILQMQPRTPVDPRLLNITLENVENMTPVARRRQQLDELAKLGAAQASAEPQMDLSALMALTDAWTGSKMAPAYQKPASSEERAMLNLKYAQELGGQEADLLKRVQDMAEFSLGSTKGDAQQERFDQQMQYKYAKDIAGFAPLIGSFQELDKSIGGFENWKGSDIPGAGLTKAAPLSSLSDRGSQIRTALTALRNQILYLRSGAQINEQEFKRLSAAIGETTLSSDRDLVIGLKRFKNELKSVLKSRQAGVNDKIRSRYESEGGVRMSELEAIGHSTPDTPNPRRVSGPAVPAANVPTDADLENMSDEELKKYIGG